MAAERKAERHGPIWLMDEPSLVVSVRGDGCVVELERIEGTGRWRIARAWSTRDEYLQRTGILAGVRHFYADMVDMNVIVAEVPAKPDGLPR